MVKPDDALTPLHIEDGKPRAVAQKLPRRWLMVCILSLNLFCSYLPQYAAIPILTKMTELFDVTPSEVNWLCTMYSVIIIPSVLWSGKLLSLVGSRWVFVLGALLLAAGSVMRCGLPLVGRFCTSGSLDSPVPAFRWLLAGQALSAVGQTLFMNSVSHFGAEWFQSEERPRAVGIVNLMNWLGSCAGFFVPILVVSGVAPTEQALVQVNTLHIVYAALFCFLLLLTALCYRDPKVRLDSREEGHQQPVRRQICHALTNRAFWLLSVAYTVYMAVLTAWDALMGSLLIAYGYPEEDSAWMALACCASSVLSTAVEAKYLKDPAWYRPTMMGMMCLLGASVLCCLGSLACALPVSWVAVAFVLQGLSAPGWGCGLELGSEVCYPAGEGTVSALMSSSGNAASIAAIVAGQYFVDIGHATAVFSAMALLCFAACLPLSFAASFPLLRDAAEASKALTGDIAA